MGGGVGGCDKALGLRHEKTSQQQSVFCFYWIFVFCFFYNFVFYMFFFEIELGEKGNSAWDLFFCVVFFFFFFFVLVGRGGGGAGGVHSAPHPLICSGMVRDCHRDGAGQCPPAGTANGYNF